MQERQCCSELYKLFKFIQIKKCKKNPKTFFFVSNDKFRLSGSTIDRLNRKARKKKPTVLLQMNSFIFLEPLFLNLFCNQDHIRFASLPVY